MAAAYATMDQSMSEQDERYEVVASPPLVETRSRDNKDVKEVKESKEEKIVPASIVVAPTIPLAPIAAPTTEEKKVMTEEEQLLLASFTAKDAQAMAKNFINREMREKMSAHKVKCIEAIKHAITLRQKECDYVVDDGLTSLSSVPTSASSSNSQLPLANFLSHEKNMTLHEMFYKHFKNELKFVLLRSTEKENQFTIRWHTEETKRMSEKELRMIVSSSSTSSTPSVAGGQVKDEVKTGESEAQNIAPVWNVYHAMLYELEKKKEFIDGVVQKLLLSCIRRIQHSIGLKETSFIFEIPYLDFALEKDDKYAVFDKLVAELNRRHFTTTDLVKVYGRMRVMCLPPVEIVDGGLDSRAADSSSSSPGKTRKDYSKVPTNKTEALDLIQDLIDLITERTQNLVYSSLTKDSAVARDRLKKNVDIESDMNKISCAILGHFS